MTYKRPVFLYPGICIEKCLMDLWKERGWRENSNSKTLIFKDNSIRSRERETETETDRQRAREREGERQTDRQRGRQIETEKETDRQTDRPSLRMGLRILHSLASKVIAIYTVGDSGLY